MSDPRADAAQDLLWRVTELERLGARRRALALRLEMARFHETLAHEALERADPKGWIDLYAAVVSLGKAGAYDRAERLIEAGRRFAEKLPSDARENVQDELAKHEEWLANLDVPPLLSDLGSVKTPIPGAAA